MPRRRRRSSWLGSSGVTRWVRPVRGLPRARGHVVSASLSLPPPSPSLSRTASGLVRSKSSLCWKPASDGRSGLGTRSPWKPGKSPRGRTSRRRPQMSGTSTSERRGVARTEEDGGTASNWARRRVSGRPGALTAGLQRHRQGGRHVSGVAPPPPPRRSWAGLELLPVFITGLHILNVER